MQKHKSWKKMRNRGECTGKRGEGKGEREERDGGGSEKAAREPHMEVIL